ncbi:glycoside hydrolase family 5 protein [Natronobiforma cellulositropha]|uniref:glycoside hydrolase family 5 protein n=1 Tax=Natronobiforma cellulositropha TaxID=1679076 RepID=UPI0021D56ED7|nr:glycoside hydrolase family 5 protein [Natronobiforma cellulositropha]
MTSHQPTDGRTARTSHRRASATTRRRFLASAALTGAVVAGGGVPALAGASAGGDGLIPTPRLEREGNLLVDPEGRPITLRGVSIADPGSTYGSWSSHTATEAVDLATRTSEGWYNRLIRVPMRPEFVAARGPGEIPHGDGRGPLLPGQFDGDDLEYYLESFVDPLVSLCAERGAYVLLTYQRDHPVSHQAEHQGFDWSRNRWECGADSDDDWRYPEVCGERGVLWHGEDQVDDLLALAEEQEFERYYGEEAPYTEPAEITNALDAEVRLFWETVADRYGGEPHVLFELYSAPTGPHAGNWGSPTYPSFEIGPDRPDRSIDGPNAKPYWDLWVDRAQPWVDTVREHAPESVVVIGAPQWNQYTYWVPENEFEGENLAYASHAFTQEDIRPLETYLGEPAAEVPVLVTEFGWSEDVEWEGEDHVWLEGTTEEFAPEFEAFFDDHPVHPVATTFDDNWLPMFFEDVPEGIPGDAVSHPHWMDYLSDSTPGQWWYEYLEARHHDHPDVTADLPVIGESDAPPRDLTGDGLYEDVTGSGDLGFNDVTVFFENLESDAVQNNPSFFDFSDNGRVGFDDVIALFERL